jgi:hypothetical protein
MAEHERVAQNKQTDVDQKHRVRQKESETSFDQFHARDTGPFSLTETPFMPRTDEHAELLSMSSSDEARANLVLHLQQTYGNRYVQRLLNSKMLQAKLTVNAPNNVYEQEADRVAEAVTRAATSKTQRQTEEEEEVQAKSLLQRQVEPEEEEPVQTKVSRMQRQAEEEEEVQMRAAENQQAIASEKLERRINDARGGGHSLSDNVRKPMEQTFGADFSGVRVHTDSTANLLSEELSAKAFTTVQDIFFRQGEYSPASDSGQKLIVHELTHVMQQTGRNKPQRQSVEEEEAQMKLDTPRMVLEGGQVNQEAKTNLQRSRGSGQSLEGTVQRMAVVAADDMNSVTDALVWTNLRNAEEKAGGPIGDLKTNQVWDQLKSGDAIRIVGHGSKDKKIEGFTAAQIAQSMKTKPHKLPRYKNRKEVKIKEVTFQSCHAGEKVAGILGTLVGDMKNELETMERHNVPVKGRTGIAFGFKGMGEATAETKTGAYPWEKAAETHYKNYLPADWFDPNSKVSFGLRAYFDAMYQCKDFKTATTNVDIFENVPEKPLKLPGTGYRKPWILAGKTKADWDDLKLDPKTPDAKGALVSSEMAPYWAAIKTVMNARGGFKPDAQAITEEVTAVPRWTRFWRKFWRRVCGI